jgi:Plasmid pRiA4b ORF-3-like protein
MSKQVLQFKVTLNYISPKVWRRIQVPDDYTFWDLHCAIQDAIGWMNCHLHGFVISEKNARPIDAIRIQMPNPEWDEGDELNESEELLIDWLPKRVKQCLYTYDFGDTWNHTILFEKMLPAEKKRYPICIAGKNDCPPEDCGGPGGYAHLRSVINQSSSREGRELREWMGLEKGGTFDPSHWACTDVEFENPKALLKEFLKNQELYG